MKQNTDEYIALYNKIYSYIDVAKREVEKKGRSDAEAILSEYTYQIMDNIIPHLLDDNGFLEECTNEFRSQRERARQKSEEKETAELSKLN